MLATRIFLAVVGVAYLVLAVWCAVKPTETADAVGYTLHRGSGQSEYFVVYGGMQIGLGLIFLWPWLQPEAAKSVLIMSLVMHACLVVMRSISFTQYSGIGNTTYALAVVEWLIFLGSAWRFAFRSELGGPRLW